MGLACTPNYETSFSDLSYAAASSAIHQYVAILGLIPLLLNVKYWRKTKNPDYLFLALYFFYWSVYDPVGSMCSPGLYPTDYFIYIIDTLPLYIVAVRAKWGDMKDIPKWVYGVGLFVISIAFISFIDQGRTFMYFQDGELIIGKVAGSNDPWATYTGIVWSGLQWGRLILHTCIVYFYLSTKQYSNRRTNISKGFWVISSLLWIFMNLYIILQFMVNPSLEEWNSDLALWWLIPFLIASILILINHTFFPDSVLISYEQIRRASKLYNDVPSTRVPFVGIGLNKIRSYLDMAIEIKAEESKI